MKFSALGIEDELRSCDEGFVLVLVLDGNEKTRTEVDVGLNAVTTWEELKCLISSWYNCDPEQITYVDEEGDTILLGSEEEWVEAKKVAKSINNKLYLNVWSTFKDNSRDSTSSDSVHYNNAVRGSNDTIPDGNLDPIHCNMSANKESVLGSHDGLGAVGGDDLQPPLWFSLYMKKFKEDMVNDITKKVTRRLQKLNVSVDQGFPDRGRKTETQKLEDCRGPNAFNLGAELPQFSSIPFSYASSFVDSSSMKFDTPVHKGVICCRCRKEINGVRYKCGNCLDFDLCAVCEAADNGHCSDHVFIKIRRPVIILGLKRKNGKLAPLLKHTIYSKEIGCLRKKFLEKHKQWEKCFKKQLQGSLHAVKAAGAAFVDESEPSRCLQKEPETEIPKINLLKPVKDTMDAQFLYDVTVPDGSKFAPSAQFIKEWFVINSGSRTWDSDTRLKFLWGTKGFKPECLEVKVPPLLPRQCGSISVLYTAPTRAGYYESHWNFVHKGHLFGHRIWCSIEVAEVIPSGEASSAPSAMNEVDEVQEPENGEKHKVKVATNQMNKNEGAAAAYDLKPDSFLSQTATPNNTPFALSPPKSPEPSEKEENVMEAIRVNVGDVENDDEEGRDHDLPDSDAASVVSLSSTESESEFVVVPMPSNFTIPFVNRRSEEPVSSPEAIDFNSVQKKPLSSGSSSVVFITSEGDESPGAIASSECAPLTKFSEKNGGEDGYFKPTEDDGHVPSESGMNIPAEKNVMDFQPSPVSGESRESPLIWKATWENQLPIHPEALATELRAMHITDPDEQVTPNPSHGAVPRTSPSEADVSGVNRTSYTAFNEQEDSTRVVNVLPEGLVYAAASIFNSARTALSALQWVPVPPSPVQANPAQEEVMSPNGASAQPSPLYTLWEMGFCNSSVNLAVLDKHKGDMEKVVEELLQHYDNDWHAHRH